MFTNWRPAVVVPGLVVPQLVPESVHQVLAGLVSAPVVVYLGRPED